MGRPSKQAAMRDLHYLTAYNANVFSIYANLDVDRLKNTLGAHKYKKVVLEIGMGTGEFLVAYGGKNKDTLCVGIEIKEERIVAAIKQCEIHDNMIFVCGKMETLAPEFAVQFFDTIFINFPDPWPKKRHAKRRFTAINNLTLLKRVLKKDGTIEVKTDNSDLFDFTNKTMSENNWVTKYSGELPQNSDDIATRYEKKYRKAGKKIYQIIVKQGK